MKLRSIEQMPEIRGKRVLVRVDHNVEFDQNGVLKDDHKIRLTLRTLEYLVDLKKKLLNDRLNLKNIDKFKLMAFVKLFDRPGMSELIKHIYAEYRKPRKIY